MPILVQRDSASSIECVVKTIEDSFFWIAVLDMTSHINLRASGSIPVEGSSKKMTLGFANIKKLSKYLALQWPLVIFACCRLTNPSKGHFENRPGPFLSSGISPIVNGIVWGLAAPHKRNTNVIQR